MESEKMQLRSGKEKPASVNPRDEAYNGAASSFENLKKAIKFMKEDEDGYLASIKKAKDLANELDEKLNEDDFDIEKIVELTVNADKFIEVLKVKRGVKLESLNVVVKAEPGLAPKADFPTNPDGFSISQENKFTYGDKNFPEGTMVVPDNFDHIHGDDRKEKQNF